MPIVPSPRHAAFVPAAPTPPPMPSLLSLMPSGPTVLSPEPVVASGPTAPVAAPRKLTLENAREAIRATDLALVIAGVDVPAAVQVKVQPGFNTACWRFQPPHAISLGDGLLGRCRATEHADIIAYTRNLYEHELSHAVETEPDLEGISKALSRAVRAATGMRSPTPRTRAKASVVDPSVLVLDERAAFSLLNLFEDARIEDRWRTATGRPFAWADYEGVPEALALEPHMAFFHLIHGEGTLAHTPDATTSEADRVAHAAAVEIATRYYTRCLDAGSTWAIIPLVAEWAREVGLPPAPPASGGSLGDLLDALTLLTGGTLTLASGETVTAAMLDAQGLTASDSDAAEAEARADAALQALLDAISDTTGRAAGPMTDPDDSSTDRDTGLGLTPNPLDLRAAERLAQRLQVLLGDEQWLTPSHTPTRRLNLRSIPAGGAPYRRHARATAGTLSVGIVVDCSGSMSGEHIDEGRLLLAALSLLARQGLVEGVAVLSLVEGRSAHHAVHTLPMPLDTIARIEATGSGEGLEDALSASAAKLATCDLVLVHSDGDITDRPINHARLAALGVEPIGCYAGKANDAKKLATWFKTVIIGDTAEQIVDTLVRTRLTRRRTT